MTTLPEEAVHNLINELSGNPGELIDKMAEAIRDWGSHYDDGPWEALPEDRKAGWRGDAERALAVVKEYLMARALSSTDHADDLAVDRFAIAMKQKLAKKREEGRGGWENKDECSAEYLSYSLIQHIWKGDPVDVANFAMMLQQRGERVVIDSETSSIIPRHPADAGKVEGDGWLPIESAPKDAYVLAWGDNLHWRGVEKAYVHSDYNGHIGVICRHGVAVTPFSGRDAPTHWRPPSHSSKRRGGVMFNLVIGLFFVWVSGFLAGIVATHFAETHPSGGDRHGE